MEEKVVYYEKPGLAHTEETLRLALERAKARGIKKMVLASTVGDTARRAAEMVSGSEVKLVVIPHQYGHYSRYSEGKQRFPGDLVLELKRQGHEVHFGTMLFHTNDLSGTMGPAAMATLLRAFCQGMKVAVEILLMATDGGCVEIGEQVVVVTGTIRGADTAVVGVAASSQRLHELHIQEIICKPLQTAARPLNQATSREMEKPEAAPQTPTA